MTEKQRQQILALSAIADHVTKKEILDHKEVREIEERLDTILANLNRNKRFFKRLV